MKLWFAKFLVVFPNQPVSEQMFLIYLTTLAAKKITPQELEIGCAGALESAKTFPKPADILEAIARAAPLEEFLGPKLLEYAPIDSEEHAKTVAELEADPAYQKEKEMLAGASDRPARDDKPHIVTRPSTRSPEEQKRILREKGFLK